MSKYLVEFVGGIPKGWTPKEVYVTGPTAVPWTITWQIEKKYDFPLQILPEGWWIAKDGEHEPAVAVYDLVPEWDEGEWHPNENGARVEVLPSWIVSRLDPEWLKLKGEDSLYQQHKKGKK